jgi:transposase
MKPFRDITDEEWHLVAPLLPELRSREELRGRPLANTRGVLNGVLWVMYSGASWSTLPRKYPSYQTCHRRFKAWHGSGVLLQVMQHMYGASADSLYALMTSRMRVPAALPAAVPSVLPAVVIPAHEATPHVDTSMPAPHHYVAGVMRHAA